MSKKTKEPIHQIEFIEWVDAVAATGWMDRRIGFPVQICYSVGSLVEESKEHIVLAGSWGKPEPDADHVNCVISIPKAWVKNRKTVKV